MKQRLLTLATVVVLAASLPAAGSAAGAADPVDCLRSLHGLDLQTVTVAQLQDALARRQITSRQLVQRYLERIEAFDRNGPGLNSVREIHPEALAQADALDAERAAGTVRGPLHGIPVLLKDNIGTDDMPTTAGSIALEGSVPVRDAFLTAQLREAGAIILGKTNLSEFANWVGLGMPNGYSSLGGQVRNAYTLGDPSGSSSGSGVAGSMAFAALTVGTETSGSILSPSQANGLVGVKPTLGLVSRAGVIPLAPSFDSAGPMVRSVADAAALLEAMAGVDPRDAATAASAGKVPDGGFNPVLRDDALAGVRLGVQGSPGGLLGEAIDVLRAQGAVIVPIEQFNEAKTVGLSELGAIFNEFKASLNAYLADEAQPTTGVETLADIIAFNDQHPDKVKYGQEYLEISQATPGIMEAGIPQSVSTVQSARAVIDATLLRYDLDAIVSGGNSNANIGAAAGYPTVAVPMGVNGRNTSNLAFLGTAWTEPQLLGFAYDYEQASQRRVPPTEVNSDELATEACDAQGLENTSSTVISKEATAVGRRTPSGPAISGGS